MSKWLDGILKTEESTVVKKLVLAIALLPLEAIENDFLVNVVRKRIEAGNLPIEYDMRGLAYLSILCEGNPGRAVITLIDLLNNGAVRITVDSLVAIYPNGHYSDDVLRERIDKLKTGTGEGKWDYLY